MKLLERALQITIITNLKPNKVCVLLGARRVGKTILIKEILKGYNEKYLLLNGEDFQVQDMLKERSISNYKRLLQGINLLVIDEASSINDIGKILKLIVDEIDGIKIIATGSSAFDLLNIFGEPLTGRSIIFHLFPVSQSELSRTENFIETSRMLEERLIFGSYPELFQIYDLEGKKIYLQNLVNTYLLKDILAIDGLRNSSKMYDLLKLLAFQIGKEVSINELGLQLRLSKNTIEKYIDLLSKVFVIFKLPGYSKNLRKEIKKSAKWYFYDNGIRNALISNFSPLALRRDIGELWKNYLISERIKSNNYKMKYVNTYFWRTYDQQEIDLIEEYEGKLYAYELKWGNKPVKAPKSWTNAYPNTDFFNINRNNYIEWIS
ncbi:MAG: ATP-binding protein [Bacteroidales bacterium]|nr:ATP-binding protein [Bacteroidales bacterium]